MESHNNEALFIFYKVNGLFSFLFSLVHWSLSSNSIVQIVHFKVIQAWHTNSKAILEDSQNFYSVG